MDTLHDYTLLTQAHEYLVALLAMILFVPFWRYLNGAPDGKAEAQS